MHKCILWGDIIKKHIKTFFLASAIIWFLLQAYLFANQLKNIFALISETQIKYSLNFSFDDISFVFVALAAVILIFSDVLNKKFKYSKIVYTVLAAIFLLRIVPAIFGIIISMSNLIEMSKFGDSITTNLRQYAVYFVIALLGMLVMVALFIFALSKIFPSKRASVFAMTFLVISIGSYTILTLINFAQQDHFYLRSFVLTIIKNALFLISIIGINYIDNESKLLDLQNENEKETVDEIIDE